MAARDEGMRQKALFTVKRQQALPRLRPDSKDAERHAILPLYPPDPRDQAALGADMFSEPDESREYALADYYVSTPSPEALRYRSAPRCLYLHASLRRHPADDRRPSLDRGRDRRDLQSCLLRIRFRPGPGDKKPHGAPAST